VLYYRSTRNVLDLHLPATMGATSAVQLACMWPGRLHVASLLLAPENDASCNIVGDYDGDYASPDNDDDYDVGCDGCLFSGSVLLACASAEKSLPDKSSIVLIIYMPDSLAHTKALASDHMPSGRLQCK